jgi:hypothetical protein
MNFRVPILSLGLAGALVWAHVAGAQDGPSGPLILIGGGVSKRITGHEPYREKETNVLLEASVYRMPNFPKPASPNLWKTPTPGIYGGIELGGYTVRPYLGVTEWVLGIGHIPLLNFGASSCVLLEASRYKPHYAHAGAEASAWMGTPLGTLKLSERFMLQEAPQTRLVYLIKLIPNGEPRRRR